MEQRRTAVRIENVIAEAVSGPRAGTTSRSSARGKKARLPGGSALDLEHRITYRFSVISSMVVRAVASMYGPKYRLVPTNWKAMAAIGRYGPMSAKDVCARTTVEPDKVTRAVDRLVALKYVQRTKDADDRRKVVLLLTPAGRRVYEDVETATRRIELLLVNALTAQEREELERITTKLQMQAEKHIGGKKAWREIARDIEPT
jgi:DNA-binding MarR family transcriptional regulator